MSLRNTFSARATVIAKSPYYICLVTEGFGFAKCTCFTLFILCLNRVGRITGRLPQELADQIVENVLELFR